MMFPRLSLIYIPHPPASTLSCTPSLSFQLQSLSNPIPQQGPGTILEEETENTLRAIG